MKKEDLNQCMLLKLRKNGLCVLLTRQDGNETHYVLYDKNSLAKNRCGGLISINYYSESLTTLDGSCDIISIKQLDSTNEVLYHVLNNVEPDTWDWVRKEENSIDVVIKAVINQENIEDIRKSIDELQNKLDNLKINLSFK
jgi:hypothetical protein